MNKTLTNKSKPLIDCDILCFSHDWTGDPLSKTHLMRVLSKDNRILVDQRDCQPNADRFIKRCFANFQEIKSVQRTCKGSRKKYFRV